jgi:regulator of sirC expression with transglutaminase-like and TPR domain
MTIVGPFEQDRQFMRLVRREHDVDLVMAALEIARDGQQNLDFTPTLERLRKSVSQLTCPVTQAGSDLRELEIVIQHMTEELQLRGDDDCFTEAEASYLNCVLETGRGLPISLSVLYVAVANELGIPLEPVAAPAHFLTRLHTDSGTVYVDAFHGGRIMQEDECLEWLHDITEMPVPHIQSLMKPASQRAIVVRMLHNLKTLFGSTERWFSAWQVQKRLALLSPSSYRERRDLAILALRAGRAGEAVTLLESCLKTCSPEDRPLLQQHLKQARRDLPIAN